MDDDLEIPLLRRMACSREALDVIRFGVRLAAMPFLDSSHGQDCSVRVRTGADPRGVHRALGDIPLVV